MLPAKDGRPSNTAVLRTAEKEGRRTVHNRLPVGIGLQEAPAEKYSVAVRNRRTFLAHSRTMIKIAHAMTFRSRKSELLSANGSAG